MHAVCTKTVPVKRYSERQVGYKSNSQDMCSMQLKVFACMLALSAGRVKSMSNSQDIYLMQRKVFACKIALSA